MKYNFLVGLHVITLYCLVFAFCSETHILAREYYDKIYNMIAEYLRLSKSRWVRSVNGLSHALELTNSQIRGCFGIGISRRLVAFLIYIH
jgi:hypothetical protein